MSQQFEQYKAARDQLLTYREDYEKARETFTWPDIPGFNFGFDWFDQIAAGERANDPALIIVEDDETRTTRTWVELSARSNQVASWWAQLGVKFGDKIILMLGNRVELWESVLASVKLGSVLIPTTTQMVGAALQDRIARGGARWVTADHNDLEKFAHIEGEYSLIDVDSVFAGAHHWADADAAPESFVPERKATGDDSMLLYFTSGTTQQAKLVEHTHYSYPMGHLSTMYWIGIEPGDVHLNVASPGWGKHAWSNVFAPWIGEATVYIYNYDRFDAIKLMEHMSEESVTSFCAPPTVWRMLIQADLTRLTNPPKKLVSAGEPLNAVVIDTVAKAWGQTIRDGFGQTESTVQVANPPGMPVKIGAMGRAMPGYEPVLIDTTTGEEAQLGELCLRLDPRPGGLMAGYYNEPERTERAMRGGIYHTGDIAEVDERGIYTYVGRADDVFKSSDYRISPFELESVLVEHPAVAEAAVVPSPDPIRLSVPKAYIILAAGHEPTPETAEAIFRYCKENVPPFRRIRRLEFADLPKTVSGKIRRVDLRNEESEKRGPDGQLLPDAQGTEYTERDFPALKSVRSK